MVWMVTLLYILAGAMQATGVYWVVRDLQILTGNRNMLEKGCANIGTASDDVRQEVQEQLAADSRLQAFLGPAAELAVRLNAVENKLHGFYLYDEANQNPSRSTRATIAVLGGGIALATIASVWSLFL